MWNSSCGFLDRVPFVGRCRSSRDVVARSRWNSAWARRIFSPMSYESMHPPPATDATAAAAGREHTGGMRVELLVVPNCPHENVASERLRHALDDTGHTTTPVKVRTMTAEAVAGTPDFAGSPTILIDGADPFAEQATGSGAFSCRIYHGEAGLAGAPSVEQLRQVLRR